jgi:hypothetical protein
VTVCQSVRPPQPFLHVSRHRCTHSICSANCTSTAVLCCVFINHSAVCLTAGPKPLPKPFLHTVPSNASSYNFQYPIFPLRPSSRCLHLLRRLPITVILRSLFPSITFIEAVPVQDVDNPVSLPSRGGSRFCAA